MLKPSVTNLSCRKPLIDQALQAALEKIREDPIVRVEILTIYAGCLCLSPAPLQSVEGFGGLADLGHRKQILLAWITTVVQAEALILLTRLAAQAVEPGAGPEKSAHMASVLCTVCPV